MQSKYRILKQVGRGQFGKVFCGIDRETGKLVALKAFHPKQLPTTQFLRELRLLTSLQHPNIVRFCGLEYCPEGRYLVMDYCEAGTLRQVLDAVGQLSLSQSLKIITDILLGLSHAHTQGIVHRDLKPENILLTIAPAGWTAHLSDFGIARSMEDLNGEGVGLGDTGSPAYMAPEQFYGRYSYASDLYAIGILLFELVVGERPFSGIPAALMQAHMNQPLVIPGTVPFLLQSVLRTALQKLPQRRFKSADEMLQSIRLAAEAVTATDLSHPFIAQATHEPALEFPEELRQDALANPIHCITVDAQQVYLGAGNVVHCRIYKDEHLTEMVQEQRMQLNAPVVRINPSPQGCYVFTHSPQHSTNHYSLYCLPTPNRFRSWEVAALAQSPDHAYGPQTHWLLTCWQAEALVAAIEPKGRWIAISGSEPTLPTSTNLQKLQQHPPSPCQIWQLPGVQTLPKAMPGPWPRQLMALDSRHGVSILPTLESLPGTHSTLRLFNRRGNCTDYFHLPVAVGLATVSPIPPHRLLAIEKDEPTLGLLVNLDPLKIARITLPFSPSLIEATEKGYVLANQDRQIALLDLEGQMVCHLELPTMVNEQVTAIAAYKDGLMVATWSGSQGALYTLDLQTHTHQKLSRDLS